MNELDGHHILVIEDDIMVSSIMLDEVIEAGATAVSVSNISDAVSELGSWHYTAAIVDLNLGHGPDYTIAERLKKDQIPFVFVTAYQRSIIDDQFHDVPYVAKPHTREHLINVLANVPVNA